VAAPHEETRPYLAPAKLEVIYCLQAFFSRCAAQRARLLHKIKVECLSLNFDAHRSGGDSSLSVTAVR
jgi:hypothetical protein